MRFLILTQYFEPEIGAPQVRLAFLARELVRLGHSVEVVTAFPNYPTGKIAPEYQNRFYKKDEWEGIPVHRLWLYASMGRGLARLWNYLSFTFTSLVGLFRAERPDVIFVESPPLTLCLPAIFCSKLWRVPVVFNVADLWPDMAKEIGALTNPVMLRAAEFLERWAYRHARFVCAVTDGIRGRLIQDKSVPREKVLFLPNGVDTRFFRPDADDGRLKAELELLNKKVFVYAGNFGYFQGLDLVLKSLKKVQEKNKNLFFLFIGNGSEADSLKALAKELGLENTRFLPPSTPAYVARLYSIAFAGLVSLRNAPSAQISRPSKIWQVMASGRPVFFVGRGEGAELIESAEAGVTVPAEDEDQIADAILKLAADPKVAAGLGANGRKVAENHYSWQKLVGNWVHEITLALNKSAIPSALAKPETL